MAITKAEALDTIYINVAGTKVIRAHYTNTFTDDSTDPDTVARAAREVAYTAADTIPSGENQLVKDLAAVLFA